MDNVNVGRMVRMVADGNLDADSAMIELDKRKVDVTAEIGDMLREAEAGYINRTRAIRQDDTVLVKGINGNPDFEANYRGKDAEGRAVVVPNKGLQMAVNFELISRIIK